MVTQQDEETKNYHSDSNIQRIYCLCEQGCFCEHRNTKVTVKEREIEEPPLIILRMSDNEMLQPKKRKSSRQRKCSVISRTLHRSKSLPDRLQEEASSNEGISSEMRLRPKTMDFKFSELEAEQFSRKRQKLCRVSSFAQVEYARIRAAIKTNNRLELLNILNRKHDDINTLGADGFAALHHAAVLGTPKVVDMLLCFGAKTNVKNTDGDYPLDLAVRAGNYDLAKYLIEKGACVDNIINGTPPTKHKQRRMGRSHTISTVV
eukprot:gene7730-13562_t